MNDHALAATASRLSPTRDGRSTGSLRFALAGAER
jgi:hypothetical protein